MTSVCQLIDDVQIDPNGSKQVLLRDSMVDHISKALAHKTLMLFHAYLRVEIMNQFDINIPMDIISICERFFHVKFISDKRNFETIYKFGVGCYEKGELFISHEIFLYLSCFFPDNDRCHNRLGQSAEYWRLQKVAEREYSIAINLRQRESGTYLWNLALLYRRQNKYPLALKLFIEASQVNNTEPKYFYKAADCYNELKDFINAEKYYLKAIEVGSDQQSICYVEYAKFLCSQNRRKDANIYVEKAEKLAKSDWRSLYRIAKFLRDYGEDYVKSKRYFLKCLEIKGLGNIYSSYGYLLCLMKQYDSARQCFEISLKKDDLKLGIGGSRYFYYGLLEYKLGNIKQAYECCREGAKRTLFTASTSKVLKKQNPNCIEYIQKYEMFAKIYHRH